MARQRSTKSLKDEATKLHSKYVRMRDGRCVRCGSTSNLQAAHIIGRRAALTRTDEANARALCAACHFYLTEHPHEHVAFFTRELGGWANYQALIDKANEGLGLTLRAEFWQERIDTLKKLIGELDA